MLVCQCTTALVCSLTYTSIGYFVVMALERYAAIVHPLKYERWFSKFITQTCYIIPPICGFALGTAPLFGWSRYGKTYEKSTYCEFDFRSKGTTSYFLFTVVAMFVIPVTTTLVFFSCIIRDLRRTAASTRRKYGENSKITIATNKALNDQSISSILTGLVYIACWLPYSIICFQYFVGQEVSSTFANIGRFLAKTCTIFSPIVYCWVEKTFRKYFREKMCEKRDRVVHKGHAESMGLMDTHV